MSCLDITIFLHIYWLENQPSEISHSSGWTSDISNPTLLVYHWNATI
jgi:hypothetical protein